MEGTGVTARMPVRKILFPGRGVTHTTRPLAIRIRPAVHAWPCRLPYLPGPPTNCVTNSCFYASVKLTCCTFRASGVICMNSTSPAAAPSPPMYLPYPPPPRPQSPSPPPQPPPTPSAGGNKRDGTFILRMSSRRIGANTSHIYMYAHTHHSLALQL